MVPGLPNDHYHAFADPMVFTLLGVGAAAAWRAWQAGRDAGVAPSPVAVVSLLVAAVALVGVVGWNVAHVPPAVAADGGFPAAAAAAQRIEGVVSGRPAAIRGLPEFKPPHTYAYPLARDGVTTVPEADADVLIIVCDDLFADVIGAACGGPAEDRSLGAAPFAPAGSSGGSVGTTPLLRFEAAPGRWVSVYGSA